MQTKFLSFIMILVFSLSTTVYASSDEFVTYASDNDEHRVVKVAFPYSKGFTEINDKGIRSGIVVDFLLEISKYTNWEYEFIPTDISNMSDDFIDEKFDIMGGIYYNEAFEEFWNYADYSTGYSHSALIALNDSYSIKSYDLSTINGKTIGVYKNATESIRRLKEFLSANNIVCDLKYYEWDDYGEDGTLYHKLEEHDVDLLLGNSTEACSDFRIITSFNSQPHYFVVQKDNPELLDELNFALEKIFEANPDFAEECYSKNFPDSLSSDIRLTESELKYIKECDILTVAIVNNFHPLYCVEATSTAHDGIIPDILNEISKFSNLRFNYIFADTYIEALNMVKDGKADILGFFLGSENDAYDMGLSLSSPYSSLNQIIIKNKSVEYPGVSLRGGILEGENFPVDISVSNVTYFSSVSDALEAVNNGEVDFIYGLSTYLEFEMQKQYYSNVVPATPVNNNCNICFAMNKPVDSELLTIINKSINQISTDTQITISNKNRASLGNNGFSFKTLIYSKPIQFVIICLIIFILLLTLFIIVTMYRVRNIKLANELNAKSSFLSRMSHEVRTPLNAIIGLTELSCKSENLSSEMGENLAKINSSSKYLLNLINDILDISIINNDMLTLNPEPFCLNNLINAVNNMATTLAEKKNIKFILHTSVSHDAFLGESTRLEQIIMNLISNSIKFTPEGGYVKLDIKELSSADSHSEITFSVEDNGAGIPYKKQKIIFEAFEQVDNKYSRNQGVGLGLAISRTLVALMGGNISLESEENQGSRFYFTLTLPHTNLPKPISIPDGLCLNNICILLAEDNDLNAEIATRLLNSKGALVERAADGLDALNIFSRSAPYKYNLILMDLSMPKLNGLETTKEIRSLKRADASEIAIIAITANSFKEDVDAAYKAGMNGFISKPYKIDELCKIILEHLN